MKAIGSGNPKNSGVTIVHDKKHGMGNCWHDGIMLCLLKHCATSYKNIQLFQINLKFKIIWSHASMKGVYEGLITDQNFKEPTNRKLPGN